MVWPLNRADKEPSESLSLVYVHSQFRSKNTGRLYSGRWQWLRAGSNSTRVFLIQVFKLRLNIECSLLITKGHELRQTSESLGRNMFREFEKSKMEVPSW